MDIIVFSLSTTVAQLLSNTYRNFYDWKRLKFFEHRFPTISSPRYSIKRSHIIIWNNISIKYNNCRVGSIEIGYQYWGDNRIGTGIGRYTVISVKLGSQLHRLLCRIQKSGSVELWKFCDTSWLVNDTIILYLQRPVCNTTQGTRLDIRRGCEPIIYFGNINGTSVLGYDNYTDTVYIILFERCIWASTGIYHDQPARYT